MLSKIFELGILVEPDAKEKLNLLDKENLGIVFEKLKNERPLVLSRELIENYLKKIELRILKIGEIKKRISMQDIVNSLNEQFQILQRILVKKIPSSDLISINKCSDGSATIIGMIKNKKENENLEIKLEDPTGIIKTVVAGSISEKLGMDDVVAASGKIKNGILYADSVIYPDVGLHSPNYAKEDITVVFSEKSDADFVISENKIEDRINNKTYEIRSPALFEISGIIILFLCGIEPLEVLRKRYIKINHENFVTEYEPDIVFSDMISEVRNYKGVTVIPKNVKINLKNREVKNTIL